MLQLTRSNIEGSFVSVYKSKMNGGIALLYVYFIDCHYRFMTEILPITDWSQEAVRPALNLILRRLDRLFSKISKKNNLKVRYSDL